MIRLSSIEARRLIDRGAAKADAGYPTSEELNATPFEIKLAQVLQALLATKNQVETVGTKVDSLAAKSETKRPVAYKFSVVRDKAGLIETITAEPIGG
jgi:hypothetical protein